VHSLLRIAGIVVLALIVGGCGVLGGGGHDSGDGCNGDGSIVLDPGYYHLVVGGDDGSGTATINSGNGSSLTERDNCHGVVRVGFANDGRGGAGIEVTPLATGACTMTISDGPDCVDSSITVAPASSSTSVRRF
jgi:hypothetical protein